MTDDNITRFPGSGPDDTEMEADDEVVRPAEGQRSTRSQEETNPLLREGPDAPDAADIEDPGEQL
jgi:hypothetical protein